MRKRAAASQRRARLAAHDERMREVRQCNDALAREVAAERAAVQTARERLGGAVGVHGGGGGDGDGEEVGADR